MQPNNQAGVPSQPPQPRPVSPQPQAPQAAAPQTSPTGERVIQPLPRPQPTPQAPIAAQPTQQPQVPSPQVAQPEAAQIPPQQPTAPSPEVLGATAVSNQVANSYEFADDTPYDDAGYDDETEIDLSEPVSWQAKEFIHHERTTIWYVAFVVIIGGLLALSVFMQAWTFTAVLVAIAVVILIYIRRPPHVMTYSLSNDGLNIDQALHRYEEFKAFGVIRDGQEFSVMLVPRKRFQPGITVYFPEEAGEDIVDALGSRLPMQDLHLDVVDRIVRTLRL